MIAYSVRQRSQELAIRSALGASPLDVQEMVLAQTLKLALCGMAAVSLMAALVPTLRASRANPAAALQSQA